MPDPEKHPRSYLLTERNEYMGVQRNVHISLRRRYLFVAIPKAANSTIKAILQQQELKGTNFQVKNIHDRLDSPLIAPFQLTPAHFESLLDSPDFFRFTFVRNPFTRLLSCYLDRVQALRSVPRKQVAEVLGRPVEEEISFADFVAAVSRLDPLQMNEHFRPQWALASPDVVDYGFIGRFESLAVDLRHVLERIWPNRGADIDTSVNLSPKKTSADERLGSFYTPELIRTVAAIYADDFGIFDYEPSIESASVRQPL